MSQRMCNLNSDKAVDKQRTPSGNIINNSVKTLWTIFSPELNILREKTVSATISEPCIIM